MRIRLAGRRDHAQQVKEAAGTPSEAPPCPHARVTPHTTFQRRVPRPVQGRSYPEYENHSILSCACMDCGEAVEIDMGIMQNPEKAEQWQIFMRAKGYMRNAAQTSMWEKLL